MKRKVVKQGHNAMTITLPACWIRENNVVAGSEINVEVKGKELLIKPSSSEGIDRTTFQMKGKGEYIHRHLGVLYRLGYDEIKVEFDDPLMIEKIQYEIEQMPGFEIVDQEENCCLIKNIATGLEKEFDNILRKIFFNILYVGEQGCKLIKQNNIKRLESLRQLQRVNNRMPNFCQRMLQKEGYKEHKKTILVYSMVWNLEQIADYYNNIFEYILNLKKKIRITKDILNIYEGVNTIFKIYYETFYSFNSEKVSNLKEKCLETKEDIERIIEKRNIDDAILLLNLNLINERIYHMTECLI